MQDEITQSELHSIHRSGDLPPVSREPTGPQVLEPTEQNQPTETLKDEAPFTEALSPVPHRASRSQHTAPASFLLPGRGLSSALIAGVIASVLSVLFTILIIHYMRLGTHQRWSLWKRTSRQASSTRT
jgi:hypothetical protein